MTDEGIRAVGAYAPNLRVDSEEFADAWGHFEASGIESKAVPEADEDALTMGWEAGRRALAAASIDATEIDWLGFATTTPPLEETDLTARLGSFFGVDEETPRQMFTGSTRAGTRALFAALDNTTADTKLVIASDCPRGEPEDEREHAAGAGAAAFVIGPNAPAVISDTAEFATPYPGTRFRRAGSRNIEGIDVTSYDRQAFIETVSTAVDELDVTPDQADSAAIQAPDGALPYRVAGPLGVETESIQKCATVHELGDTGAASVPLSIATALTEGNTPILGAAFGSGAGADAFFVTLRDDVPTETALEGSINLSYAKYLRRRGTITGSPPAGGGAYVSVPTWRRSIPQRHQLVAGQCPECDALVFPPEGACTSCGALVEFEPVTLPAESEVVASTVIARGGEPPEFATQQAASGEYSVTITEFESEGESVTIPMQVVADGPTATIGDTVTTVVRRIYEQEGVIRYGRKARVND